jgi:hypothetical protein
LAGCGNVEPFSHKRRPRRLIWINVRRTGIMILDDREAETVSFDIPASCTHEPVEHSREELFREARFRKSRE